MVKYNAFGTTSRFQGKEQHPYVHLVPNNPIKHYVIVVREKPRPGVKAPIYKMKIFAQNRVVAKSRAFFYLNKLRKLKKTHCEVLALEELKEKDPTTVKNYGIWLRYNSRTGVHNMYKEFRDVTITGAVKQLYEDMGGRHKAKFFNIQIIKTAVIPDDDVKRPNVAQFVDPKVKFPLVGENKRPGNRDRRFKKTFHHTRPSKFGW